MSIATSAPPRSCRLGVSYACLSSSSSSSSPPSTRRSLTTMRFSALLIPYSCFPNALLSLPSCAVARPSSLLPRSPSLPPAVLPPAPPPHVPYFSRFSCPLLPCATCSRTCRQGLRPPAPSWTHPLPNPPSRPTSLLPSHP